MFPGEPVHEQVDVTAPGNTVADARPLPQQSPTPHPFRHSPANLQVLALVKREVGTSVHVDCAFRELKVLICLEFVLKALGD